MSLVHETLKSYTSEKLSIRIRAVDFNHSTLSYTIFIPYYHLLLESFIISNTMSPERRSGEPDEISQRHDIQLGVSFKPFEAVQTFNNTPQNQDDFPIPESYDHFLYVRKPVSFHGIDGRIDVISEVPVPIIKMWAVQAEGYMCYVDHPFGPIEKITHYQDGKFEDNKVQSILRFSFQVNNPREYAKLLRTYGLVTLNCEEFLLTFAANQDAVKKGFKKLEKGNSLQVVEKNLFSMKRIEELAKRDSLEDDEEEGPLPKHAPKKRGKCPDRIAFVDIPVDLDTFGKIDMVFLGFDGYSESEFPVEPLTPSRELVPVFA